MIPPPTPGYLDAIGAALQMPPATISARGPAPRPPTYGSGPAPTGDQLFGPQPSKPPPGTELSGTQGAQADQALAAFAKGAGAPPPTAPPVPPPGAAQPERRFIPFGGGAVPAREVERRGPTLRHAQDERNAAMQGAIDAVAERGAQTSSAEFAMALDQERQARVRQEAAEYSAAERADELAQRQADFDSSARALSKMHMDPERFWASRSTGQKIAGIVSIFLGGFLQGMRGGPNVGLDMVNQAIDRDIKAQEFDYMAKRDTMQAKQTAFALAMQKYQNVDAARAMARTAALDAVQAQIGQMAALWKGTDAANRATMAQQAVQDERMQQIAQGILFLPASAAPRMYRDARTGLTFTEAEMKKRLDTMEERDFKREETLTGIAGKLAEQQQGKADEGASHIATALQGANVPQARAAAEKALAALRASPGGAIEAGARGVLPGAVANAVMSDDANAREQMYQTYANHAMKALMGNVTASEEVRAAKMLGSAADPKSRERAILTTLEMLEAVEKNAKAGQTPAAQRTFDRQRLNAEGAPPTAPKDSRAGW